MWWGMEQEVEEAGEVTPKGTAPDGGKTWLGSGEVGMEQEHHERVRLGLHEIQGREAQEVTLEQRYLALEQHWVSVFIIASAGVVDRH